MESHFDWPALWEQAQAGRPGPTGQPPQPASEPVPALPGIVRERCTATSKRAGRRCMRWPLAGATVCAMHGGSAPQVRDAAARRVQEQQARALAGKIVPGADLGALGDPFTALETALGHSHALAERLMKIVDKIPDDQLSYRGKLAEQVRGELTAAQRALSDLRQAAAESLKIGLAERRARIDEAKLGQLERAMTLALQAAEVGPEQRATALKVLRRELTGHG